MSYTNTLLHCKFDADPLTNEVGSVVATQSGTPTLVDGVHGKAWQMSQSTYADFAVSDPSSAFSMGFWLKPVNPGMVKNPTSGLAESMVQALISKCTFSTTGVGALSTTTATGTSFMVYEKTLDNNKNSLVIVCSGLDNTPSAVTSTTTSASYDADIYHYFWIVYNGSTVRVYIDLSLVASVTTGTVPVVLNSNAVPLSINLGAPGSGYSRARNKGVIDDFILITTATTSFTTISRAANMGAEYIADSSLTTLEEVSQCVLFDDPSTIQANAVFANRGNVYVARSDGKLMRGVRTLWKSKRDFNTERELGHVTIVSKTGSSPTIENATLKITNEVIRI